MEMWSVYIKHDGKEVKIGELTDSELHYHIRKNLIVSWNNGKHKAVASNDEVKFVRLTKNKKLVESYKRAFIELRKSKKN